MTASQLLIMAGIILLAHELSPFARVVFGLSIGFWGVMFAVGALLF